MTQLLQQGHAIYNDVMLPNPPRIFAPTGVHIFKGEPVGLFSSKPPHLEHSAGAKRNTASNTGLPFDCGVSWDSLGTLNRNGSKPTLQRNRAEDRKKALQLGVWTPVQFPAPHPTAHSHLYLHLWGLLLTFVRTCTLGGRRMDTHIQLLNNTWNSFHKKQMGALLQGCRVSKEARGSGEP